MFSPVKAIVAGALVFALGGVFLVAQPFAQPEGGVPGAEQGAEPAPPVRVTGTTDWDDGCTSIDRGEPSNAPAIERNQLMDCEVRASDPRVSGTWSIVRNGLWWDDIGVGMKWGTATLDGADGGWECTYTDIGDPYPDSINPINDLYRVVCSGTRGFEDLAYVWHAGMDGGPEGFGDGFNVDGFIFPEMPTGWGPPLPITE